MPIEIRELQIKAVVITVSDAASTGERYQGCRSNRRPEIAPCHSDDTAGGSRLGIEVRYHWASARRDGERIAGHGGAVTGFVGGRPGCSLVSAGSAEELIRWANCDP